MKKNIAIIAGGYSSELMVSLKSVETIYANLPEEQYNSYVVIVNSEGWNVRLNEALIPINKNDLEINFLFYWFKSIAKYIESQGTGATVKGVKVNFIKNLKIPLPPIKEQIKIIDTLDQLFNNLNLLKTENQSKRKHLQDLKKSLLEQAFQGKL